MSAYVSARPWPLLIGVVLLAGIALGMSGCFGAVTNPGPPVFSVSSTPPGAAIFLNGASTGHATPHQFVRLAPGVYDVRLTFPGLPDHTGKAVVSDNRSTAYHFTLTDGLAHISGYVTESLGGPGVAGSVVRAGAAQTVTDQTGKYDLFVPPGTYHLTADKPGWATGRRLGVAAAADTMTAGHIVQRPVFFDASLTAEMDLQIDGIKAGDVVSSPIRVTVRAVSPHAVADVTARLGHADALTADFEATGSLLEFMLDPGRFVPGVAALHVAAYDVQYNGVQQTIPFTVASRQAGGTALAAPPLTVTAYTASESATYLGLGGSASTYTGLGLADGDGGHHFVNVAWDRVMDAAGYRLLRREDDRDDWQPVADIPRMRTSYVDASPVLRPGPTFYYALAVLDETGAVGDMSRPVAVTLLEPFSVYLARPLHRAFNVADTVELQWLAPALPPRPEGHYEYEYEVRLQKVTGSRPDVQQRVTNSTTLRVRALDACTQYTWDLYRATATLVLSDQAKAVAISGSHRQPAGGSVNGGYMFSTACPLAQQPGSDS